MLAGSYATSGGSVTWSARSILVCRVICSFAPGNLVDGMVVGTEGTWVSNASMVVLLWISDVCGYTGDQGSD